MTIKLKRKVLYRKLGERIYIARRKKGYTQDELSVVADVDRTYISQIESGGREPSFHVVSKLARALKIKVDDLIQG